MNLLRLKKIQEERGLSNVALANMVDVTPATISNINKGNNFPKPELLRKIAEALDIDIREMFYHTKDITTPPSPPFNGFVEYENEVYKIREPEDLEKLMQKLESKSK